MSCAFSLGRPSFELLGCKLILSFKKKKRKCEIRVNNKPFNYNSLNVCTETIGFIIIRKLFDKHERI